MSFQNHRAVIVGGTSGIGLAVAQAFLVQGAQVIIASRSQDATKLKLKLEDDAQYHKVDLIYTHTEETNNHVIELNKKIGYQEVRRGSIWDDVIRVSLIKKLS